MVILAKYASDVVLDGKAASLMKRLFEDEQLQGATGLERALEMVDCFVLDWPCIRHSHKWKETVPDVGKFYCLRADLKVCVFTGSGYSVPGSPPSLWAHINSAKLEERQLRCWNAR